MSNMQCIGRQRVPARREATSNHPWSTINDQRATGNGQTDFYMRRVSAVPSWIGVWIWRMVPVTAELESQE
jgi:hypothetical protein